MRDLTTAVNEGYLVELDGYYLISKEKGRVRLTRALNSLFSTQLLVNPEIEDNRETFERFCSSFSREALIGILVEAIESDKERSDYELMLNDMLSFL